MDKKQVEELLKEIKELKKEVKELKEKQVIVIQQPSLQTLHICPPCPYQHPLYPTPMNPILPQSPWYQTFPLNNMLYANSNNSIS